MIRPTPGIDVSKAIGLAQRGRRDRPVRIQSLFMRVEGQPPSEEEIAAYVARLQEITAAGGAIKKVQVYTVARPPAEAFVTPLSPAEVDAISDQVHNATGLPTKAYYAA